MSKPGRALPTRVYLPTVAGRVAASYGPFPLLVWAHGRDATVNYFDPLLRDWASQGFVVAAPTFPLTHAGTSGGSVFSDYVNQPADVTFVITRVLALAGPAGVSFRGLVDGTRIGVGGHSLGAVTVRGLTEDTCCVDPRVKAAVQVDGAPLRFATGATVQRGVPTLWIHGDADQTVPVEGSDSMFSAARPPKYLAILRGMPHTPFKVPAAFSIIVTLTSDFFNAYLNPGSGSATRLLEDGSSAPARVVFTAQS